MRQKMIRLISPMTIIALALIFAYGCLDDDPVELPTVSTSPIEDVTAMSAKGGGAVTDEGGAMVTARGLVWDTSAEPTVDENLGHVSGGSGEGEFTLTLSGLSSSTEYHVRAYATNVEGTAYGENLSFTTDTIEGDLLFPGNWENASEANLLSWAAEEENENPGYIFGTNIYGDDAYGQVFEEDGNFTIAGAFFWIGARDGTEGDVVFKIWDYDGESPGDVLGSETIPMAEVEATVELGEAMWVEFDQPVSVSGNFVIGVDISDLKDYVHEEYGLGHVSSAAGDGAEAGLALIREAEDGWIPVLAYDVDVDIAIFPLAEMTVGSDEKKLTLVGRSALDSRAQQLSGRIAEIERKRR